MPERLTPEQRSRLMARVATRDTKPEVVVRRLLHRMGYRFRLHPSGLPGKPDIVLPRHRKVVLVHGCFWHQHPDCKRAKRPASNVEFWDRKLSTNVERDKRVQRSLEESGWHVLVIWECETRDAEALEMKLTAFLDNVQGRGTDLQSHGY